MEFSKLHAKITHLDMELDSSFQVGAVRSEK